MCRVSCACYLCISKSLGSQAQAHGVLERKLEMEDEILSIQMTFRDGEVIVSNVLAL